MSIVSASALLGEKIKHMVASAYTDPAWSKVTKLIKRLKIPN